jgi:hypothetical protein
LGTASSPDISEAVSSGSMLIDLSVLGYVEEGKLKKKKKKKKKKK